MQKSKMLEFGEIMLVPKIDVMWTDDVQALIEMAIDDEDYESKIESEKLC